MQTSSTIILFPDIFLKISSKSINKIGIKYYFYNIVECISQFDQISNTNQMKKLLLVLTLFSIIFLAILCKPSDNPSINMPPPVEGVIVKMDGEDVPKRKAREAWFELMHQAEEGVDWREIEFQNNINSARYKNELRANIGSRNPILDGEIVADGNLEGKWIERGSNNNAGNMITVNYFKEEDMLFGRSAGGTLWKGDRSGFNWEVVNQDYRFQTDLVEARYLPNGDIRYIAALNQRPVYSDDEGQTWTPSEGMETTSSARMIDFIEDNNDNMYVLQKAHNINFISAYRSTDNGSSWQEVYEFTGRNHRDYNLVTVGGSDDIMVIEQKDEDQTRIFMWNEANSTFDIVQENSPVGFGSENDRANFNAVFDGDSLRLFMLTPISVEVIDNGEISFEKRQKLMTSVDTARTWDEVSVLPTVPWDVGLFVSPTNYKKMNYGEVNPYTSSSGGKFWSKTSNWWEYYNDIFNKIHADIMDIKEFEDQDGEPFTIVCNHGGISQSYDYGETFDNIGLISLNISQYYSVATHPTDREWIFAGAQDQGFQRGRIEDEEEASLDQVISGDYGHIVFSGPQDKMWTVYPWGSVSYYNNPKTQGPTAGWELKSDNETVWIPPLLGHPDKTQNAIFMAGGNHEGGSGSHMIRLDIDGNGQIVPSQFDYDFRQTNGGEVSAMGISPLNFDLIFVATTGGHIFKSDDGGDSFERKQVGLPTDHYLYGSCIKPSLIDENVVYVSGSGYSNPGVYKSTDAGETYVPMNIGLPGTMVFSLAPNEDESLIFAATEAGPYVYVTEKDEWFELSGVGTPNQTYWSVEYIPETQTARFGTYGRGIWDFDVINQVTNIKDEEFADEVNLSVYPNPFVDFITIDSKWEKASNVSIVNQSGEKVFSEDNKLLKKMLVDMSDFTTGIYFVTITSENRSVTEKIIKQ